MDYQERQVPRSVFRAYDIRGIINADFDEHAFYTIGRAIASKLHSINKQRIILARDGRLTSESLARALEQGLINSGITVFNLGAVATPVMYFATEASDIDCGLMVTGSHNPAPYNGIKIVLDRRTLVQSDINELYELIVGKQFITGLGKTKALPIIEQYKARVIKDIQLKRPLKVVVDCGNGIAGTIIPNVIASLGCEVYPLFCDVDGRFPNHHPDPTVESNLTHLKETVMIHQADIGLAFDGDADRLGIVTNQAKTIWPDRLMMFYSKELLKRLPNATIVYDVKCSTHLHSFIKHRGGTPIMCPTGHSIVKATMKSTQAALAGEMSGHLFFKDRWYGFDDALYSACRLLEIVSQSPLSVHEQFLAIPDSVNTPEIQISISDELKFLFMAQFCEQAFFDEATIIRIDGLRAEFSHGWGLVRASNTTPCLVTRFEACDETSLLDIQQRFKEQLLAIDCTLPIPF